MASQQANLHRSKSATSVKERRKHPIAPTSQDPDVSRAHALIAAHRAMDRSQARPSTALHRADNNANRRSNDVNQRIQFSPATQLRRQRSVLQSKAPYLAAALQVPEEPRYVPKYPETDVSEFGAMGETYGAEPSSYRRIRRTKSLLTPRRCMFSSKSPHISLSGAPTLRPSTSIANITFDGSADPGLGLRIRHSLNFLRPATRINPLQRGETSLGSHDDVVLLARGQYLDCMPQPFPERKPSLVLQKFRQRRNTFRKSVRSHAFTDPVAKNDSDSALSDVPSPKRSVSASLRNRFMKVFGKSVSRKSSLPPQQLDATRQHFSADPESQEQSATFDDYHVSEDDERRQSFYVPSKSAAESSEELDRFSPNMDLSASRESMHSNSRSRVTSWSNSTSTTSSASRPGALQQNRLSIIKEDGGPHQPSCSAGRHIGGISVFQDPLPDQDENGRPLPQVDSQRIYSALMRRIGEEEAEIEQTKAAFERIQHNLDLDQEGAQNAGFSTIRTVSRTTLGASQEAMHHNTEHINQGQDEGMIGSQHRANLERRREQLAVQEEQQSFFPFSSQYKPSSISPFRKLLDDRKSKERHRSTDDIDDSATVIVSSDLGRDNLPPRHAALSSESIYSTTTNGGVNENYVPPVGSIDDLRYTGTGIATIIPVQEEELYVPIKTPTRSVTSEREWKSWISGQIDNLTPSDSKALKHFREHAQTDPEDVNLGAERNLHPKSMFRTAKQLPLVEPEESPRHESLVPQRNSSRTRSQSGVLKRQSINDLFSHSGRSDENRKVSSGLRKISPGNIARMIKERKSQMLLAKPDNTGKENRPSTARGDSPPLSTPGRLGLQMRSGNGRLRKRASEQIFSSKILDNSTIKKTSTPGRAKPPGHPEESPTEKVKLSLSARLSRPFNMDVPESNRPFDSMYLGKGELDRGAPGARLSVAQHISRRGPGGYSGLGANPFEGEQATALPQMTSAQRSDSGIPVKDGLGGLWNSKRMVSEFLKKRRGKDSSGDESGQKEGSPAFI